MAETRRTRAPSRKRAPQKNGVLLELPEMTHSQRLTLLLAHTFTALGFKDIRAVAPGFQPPPMVKGAQQDHRPNVAAKYRDGKVVYVDVLVPGEDPEIVSSRWQLFASAAALYGGQFHVATPEWWAAPAPKDGEPKGLTGTDIVKNASKLAGVEVHRVWPV